MTTTRRPPCIDCDRELGPVGAEWSSCYLCDFCRTNRYGSEAAAAARVRAFKDRCERDPEYARKANERAAKFCAGGAA